MTDEQQSTKCSQCGSLNWSCIDEQSRNCWGKNGELVSTRVIGVLKCRDCGYGWLDYSVDPCQDEGDCECEDY